MDMVINEIQSNVGFLKLDLQENVTEVDRLKVNFLQLNNDVGSIMNSQIMLEEGINELNHNVADLRGEMREGFAQVKSSQTAINEGMAAMREDMAAMMTILVRLSPPQ